MESQSTESGHKRTKQENIKLILNSIGMYLVGFGIYIIHHDLNKLFEKYFPKTVEISLIYAVLFIILGLILFNRDNLKYFFKNIKSSHKFYFLVSFAF